MPASTLSSTFKFPYELFTIFVDTIVAEKAPTQNGGFRGSNTGILNNRFCRDFGQQSFTERGITFSICRNFEDAQAGFGQR